MATVCEVCGSKTNEVKSGGGIESKGLHIEIDVKTKEDLTRDVLKVNLLLMYDSIFYLYILYFSLKHALWQSHNWSLKWDPQLLEADLLQLKD